MKRPNSIKFDIQIELRKFKILKFVWIRPSLNIWSSISFAFIATQYKDFHAISQDIQVNQIEDTLDEHIIKNMKNSQSDKNKTNQLIGM